MTLDIKSGSEFMDEIQTDQIKEAGEKVRRLLADNDYQLRVLAQKIGENLLRNTAL